jgi:hypothetical protein
VKKYNGKSLGEWSDETGIKYWTLHARINRMGMTIEEAIETPINHSIFNGKTLNEWSEITNIKYCTLYARINIQGMTIEEAVETPLGESNINQKFQEFKKKKHKNKQPKKRVESNNNQKNDEIERLLAQHKKILELLAQLNNDFPYASRPSVIKRIAKQKIRCIDEKQKIEQKIKELDKKFKREKHQPGFLYVIELYNDDEFFYKVGISRSPPDRKHGRWEQIKQHYQLGEYTIVKKMESFYHARRLEMTIKKRVQLYKPKKLFEGWTECFIQEDES